MRKFSFILGISAILLSTGVKAQHEVKTNVLGLIFNQFGLTYEYILNDEMGAVASIAYFTPPSSFSYEYTAISFTPEFRYYLDPSSRDADKYFVGGYLKYRNTSSDDYYTYSVQDAQGNFTGETATVGQNTNGVALGIVGGRKWVTRSGFLFESWVGFGRYLFTAESYTDGWDPDTDDPLGLVGGLDDLPTWDIRLGLTVGWRIDN